MKRKKGFTLVELLAVIVILAVVILIAVTAVIPRINNAKKNSLLDEALIYLKAAREDFVISSHESEEPITSKCITISELNEKYVKKNDTNYSGTVASEYSNGEFNQTISLTNGKYYVYGSGDLTKNNIYEEKSNEYLETCPTISKADYEDTDEDGTLSLGDKITIGEDVFYYMLNDSNGNLVILPEYNISNESRQTTGSSSTTFSSSQFWADSTDYSPFGDSEYNYVYRTNENRNSTFGDTDNYLKDIINGYKDYLNKLGVIQIIDARLMSLEEATAIGCLRNASHGCPEFAANNSYWLGTAVSSSSKNKSLFYIVNYSRRIYTNRYDLSSGIRPVIIISPSSI